MCMICETGVMYMMSVLILDFFVIGRRMIKGDEKENKLNEQKRRDLFSHLC